MTEDADSERHWDSAQEGAERIVDGDLDGAVAYLTQLCASEPDNPYAQFFLGTAYFEQTHYVKALRAYLNALSLSPDYVGAMVATGQTLRMLGRHAEAIRMGRQVLARMPDDTDALFLLGACHFARGDDEKAREYLTRFIAAGPEIEAAIEAQGMLQVLAGEIVEDASEDDVN